MRVPSSLVAKLGPKHAATEFRWMRAAARTDLPLDHIVARRVAGEPLQYILGTQPFGPLNLVVRPPVLIPRPETEHWVLRLARAIRPAPHRPLKLLDLGTGSGCIPLLLAHLAPPHSLLVHAVDISPHALALANHNAALNSLQSSFSSSNADFLHPDFPDPATRLMSPFDIITSNPPYIPWREYLDLPPSVRNYEDPKALFGGPDGLEFYHAIARLVQRQDILKPSSILALEVGHDQAPRVESIIRETGRFLRTEIWLDPWEKQRTVVAHAS